MLNYLKKIMKQIKEKKKKYPDYNIYKVSFKEFEKKCKEIAKLIKQDKNIKNIFGLPRSGMIPAVRISYLTGLPLTNNPKTNETAIIDDCIDTGATRHSFDNFNYFFVLIDKHFENINKWVEFWWRNDEYKKKMVK